MERKHIVFSDYDEGPEWVVTYHLGYSEIDDDMDGSDEVEIIVNARSVEIAARYAQQYLRKMQVEDETSSEWVDAEILSVELY